jgi:hypothetical protein
MVTQKCPNGSRYIEVRLAGGLGNQLFQVAYGISLSLEIGAHVKFLQPIKGRVFSLGWLGINNEVPQIFILQNQDIEISTLSECTCIVRNHYVEPSFISEPRIEFNENTQIQGYFQSELFFFKYRYPIKEFLIRKLLSQTNYDEIGVDSVELHVRLGDFYRSRKARRFHGVINDEYVALALHHLDFFSNQKVLRIITDDTESLKKVLPNSSRFASLLVSSELALNDFRILTESRNLIISNSTFSWWGAYLSSANVIAPAKWFAGKYSRLDLNLFLYPSTWTVI